MSESPLTRQLPGLIVWDCVAKFSPVTKQTNQTEPDRISQQQTWTKELIPIYLLKAGYNFSFQCNKLKKSSFSNKKEIVIDL